MTSVESAVFAYPIASFIPFQDRQAAAAARAITREQLPHHPNPDWRIQIIDAADHFYRQFAEDFVQRIRQAREDGRQLVVILPVGPVPQYQYAAQIINRERISLRHLHTFNMDEYADADGNTAPPSWEGSFQRAMYEHFFFHISPELRPPQDQIHFPTSDVIDSYSDRIADLGGADICYGGIGWAGHIAFWEPQLGFEFAGDLEAYQSAGARTVELHPLTIAQNALHSFGGDWSYVPPKANTIGPRDIFGARERSFWLDGDIGGGVSWQRFIARLVAYGPITEFIPGSLLQLHSTEYTLLGSVADDIRVHLA